MTAIASEPVDAPVAGAVMARASGENFPVASRLLGRRERDHLLALYGYARLVDELGDSHPGDRERALDWLQDELDVVFSDHTPSGELLGRLQATVRACSLERGPFDRLLAANRMDQRVSSYATWEELRAYCDLSANPVGELVLAVFGLTTPERVGWSDSICTALQLAEHCQDVAEDLEAGRVYLPQEDFASVGATVDDLRAPRAGAAAQALLALEVRRGRGLLDEGLALVASVPGRARLAVAGFLGGGRAAFDAIERHGYDVLKGPPRAGRVRVAAATLATLRDARRAGR